MALPLAANMKALGMPAVGGKAVEGGTEELRHKRSASAIFSLTNFRMEISLLSASDPREQIDAVRPIPGKFFLVGGPKQSICRFRRADVALYEVVKERLRHVGAEVLYLTTGGGDSDGRNKAETVVARGASRSTRR
jgi:hypothetical protein